MLETNVLMTVRHADDLRVGDLARKLYEVPGVEVPVITKVEGIKPALPKGMDRG